MGYYRLSVGLHSSYVVPVYYYNTPYFKMVVTPKDSHSLCLLVPGFTGAATGYGSMLALRGSMALFAASIIAGPVNPGTATAMNARP